MKNVFRSALLLLSVLTCFAFAKLPGGEGFEVYINGKLTLQRFGQDMQKPHTLRFEAGTEAQTISIRYHHCGQAGKNRSLLVKDEKERVLKTIRFSDGKNGAAMDCKVSDLIRFDSPVKGSLRLYYLSDEIPDGRLLLSLVGPEAGLTASR